MNCICETNCEDKCEKKYSVIKLLLSIAAIGLLVFSTYKNLKLIIKIICDLCGKGCCECDENAICAEEE